ncbi:MAG: hypothetical protein ACH37Z_00090 [Anaerolineae bacterium]
MDFIETIFGISPDGGNGMFEAVLIAAAAGVIMFAVHRWRAVRRRMASQAARTIATPVPAAETSQPLPE